MTKLYFLLTICVVLFSCKKNDIAGRHTVVKGNVSEKFRGIKVENYRITLIKAWRCCSDFMCGWCSEEVATVYTDQNGNYAIEFDYKLTEGQSYALESAYDNPYRRDAGTTAIVKGKTNVVNIGVWKPVKIRLNLNIKNNNFPPLIAGISINNNYAYNTENTYEKEITKTCELWTDPNSNGFIDFWFNEDYGSSARHLVQIPFTTTLEEVYEFSYDIDCATF